ncbi:unnamed protein product [Cylicocyclus nassatus]|uniref:Uncharacterized protein n=1 Tax=Cylicocyclus nassatus TaxID=53992 RepID=A0AA36GQY0_CYLNA|nr:unnamed protein product [Cylicocyclus nassatus]
MSPCCHVREYEIKSLISRYGNRHGITPDDMQIRLVEKCNGGDYHITIGKFEVRIPQCNEFRKYLLHVGRFMPEIKMVHVKCDRAHYSHCLKYNCKEMDYVDLANCAYNNTI